MILFPAVLVWLRPQFTLVSQLTKGLAQFAVNSGAQPVMKRLKRLLQFLAFFFVTSLSASNAHAEVEYEYLLAAKVWSSDLIGTHLTLASAAERHRLLTCGQHTDCTAVLLAEETTHHFWRIQGISLSWVVEGGPFYDDIVIKDRVEYFSVHYHCPQGWQVSGISGTTDPLCYRPKPLEASCPKKCNGETEPVPSVGNPILVANGAKYQDELDYRNARGTLSFTRTYRSDKSGWSHNFDSLFVDHTRPLHLPKYYSCYWAWWHVINDLYCFKYWYAGEPNYQLARPDGTIVHFDAASQKPRADINARMSPWLDETGVQIGWLVTERNVVESYSFDSLLRQSSSYGQITRYHYSDVNTPATTAPRPGLLIRVTDAFGAELNFTYNARGQISSMVDPEQQVYLYSYDVNGNVEQVRYPDGRTTTYVYGELDKTANVARPRALTGIVDGKGKRFATFTYNDEGKAATTEHAGGVEKYEVSYIYDYIRRIKDPHGTTRQYNFVIHLGVNRNTSISQPGPGGVGTVSSSVKYGENANVESKTNSEGVTTTFSYNLDRNLETSRTEAFGTADARTITTEWHPTLRLRAAVAEPKRITRYTYDSAGNVKSVTVQATNDGNGSQGFSAAPVGGARKSTYEYNAYGQLLVENGPREDVVDETHYTYEAATGNLTSVVKPLGRVSYFSNYDAHGRVRRIQAPDGVVTDLTYTPRGWLESQTVQAGGVSRTTSYTYDENGQLAKVSMPGGVTVDYTYDDAHRLTDISDSLGNSIRYTLDPMGNRTLEKVYDPDGQLSRQVSREFDALNFLKKQTGAAL